MRRGTTSGITVEPLPGRTMMSTTLAGGVLHIDASAASHSDVFVFYMPSPTLPQFSTIYVYENGVATQFVAAAVTKVSIKTGDGNDSVTAEAFGRPVLVESGRGNDTVTTGSGNDVVHCEGALMLGSSDGADLIHTGSGSDTIYTGSTNDTVYGDGGSDFIHAYHNPGKLFGGADLDQIDFRLSFSGVRARIAEPGEPLSTPGGFIAADVEYVQGSKYADVFTGNSLGNAIFAGGGDDTVFGNGGDDNLYGEGGNDYLDGGAGNDLLSDHEGRNTLMGSNGNDTIYAGGVGDYINAGAGYDTVYARRGDRILNAEFISL